MNKFKKFCIVGGVGFVVDSLLFLFLCEVTDHVMLSRLLSFWLAATVTWFGNRVYTYRQQAFTGVISQWSKHMLSAHLSGGINLLVFWGTKDVVSMPFAFCIGVLAGLLTNYLFANRFVFVSD